VRLVWGGVGCRNTDCRPISSPIHGITRHPSLRITGRPSLSLLRPAMLTTTTSPVSPLSPPLRYLLLPLPPLFPLTTPPGIPPQVDQACLHYVLHCEAGAWPRYLYRGGSPPPDTGADGRTLPCRLAPHGIDAAPKTGPPKIGASSGVATAAPAALTRRAVGPPRGMRIDDFYWQPAARRARLSKAHVVALRVFTTQVHPPFGLPFFLLSL
jgi:hypothetical protein